ncbi:MULTISPECIES: phage holin family protein [Paenibacillus]|uniref:phage holin family protein n=1 Tax=Paenibacillus TaxID=44249 RepID=UPI00096E0735|nr:hypothetical protein BK136_11160 [Paenibacillus amylolyticus]
MSSGAVRRLFLLQRRVCGGSHDRHTNSNTGLFGITRKMRSPFYIANELLSIIENGGKLGAPIKSLTGSALNVYL